MRQTGEDRRELMRQTTKAHDVERRDATARHDIEMRALSAQGVQETKSLTDLLLAHIDTAQLEREIAAREQSEIRMANQPVAGANGANGAAK
jgi:hypothetical protein